MMLLPVRDRGGKAREYVVRSMTARSDISSGDASISHPKHLQ